MKVNEQRQIQCRDGQGVVVFSFEIQLKVEIDLNRCGCRYNENHHFKPLMLFKVSEYY